MTLNFGIISYFEFDSNSMLEFNYGFKEYYLFWRDLLMFRNDFEELYLWKVMKPSCRAGLQCTHEEYTFSSAMRSWYFLTRWTSLRRGLFSGKLSNFFLLCFSTQISKTWLSSKKSFLTPIPNINTHEPISKQLKISIIKVSICQHST